MDDFLYRAGVTKLDSNLCKIIHCAPITTAGKSILMDVLASSPTTTEESHKVSDLLDTTELQVQTCVDSDSDKITSSSLSSSASASSIEQNCVDTRSLLLDLSCHP